MFIQLYYAGLRARAYNVECAFQSRCGNTIQRFSLVRCALQSNIYVCIMVYYIAELHSTQPSTWRALRETIL